MRCARLYLFVVAWGSAAFAAAAEDAATSALYTALKGRWEGTLTGAFRAQEVSWHFELDQNGALKGYMGPSTAGMPSLPMENLAISDGQVSFSIASQHGTFEGAIVADGITGIWQQGTALRLQMQKKDFVFASSDSVRAALLGHWELSSQTAVHLDFAETDAGMLTGTLAVPSLNLRETPLVDIFVTDDGYAQFATDNGRRFAGRLLNGVLVGEYTAPGTQQRATFAKAGQREQGFDLEVTDTAYEQLAGIWQAEIFFDDILLEFYRTEDNTVRARLLANESRLVDPLLELVMDGANISFTTFSGRTFTGALTAQGIVGEQRTNMYPSRMTYTRKLGSE